MSPEKAGMLYGTNREPPQFPKNRRPPARALLVEPADPDIAEAHGLRVVLQAQRLFGGVRGVVAHLPPDGRCPDSPCGSAPARR